MNNQIKQCPYCSEEIKIKAKNYKYYGYLIIQEK
jgi:hypothetical protein